MENNFQYTVIIGKPIKQSSSKLKITGLFLSSLLSLLLPTKQGEINLAKLDQTRQQVQANTTTRETETLEKQSSSLPSTQQITPITEQETKQIEKLSTNPTTQTSQPVEITTTQAGLTTRIFQQADSSLEEKTLAFFPIKQGNQYTYSIRVSQVGKIGFFTRFNFKDSSVDFRDFLKQTPGTYHLELEVGDNTESGHEIKIKKDDLGLYRYAGKIIWMIDPSTKQVIERIVYNPDVLEDLNIEPTNETPISTSLLYAPKQKQEQDSGLESLINISNLKQLVQPPKIYQENGATLVSKSQTKIIKIGQRSYTCQEFLQIPYEGQQASDILLEDNTSNSPSWRIYIYFAEDIGLVKKVQEDNEGNLLYDMELIDYKLN